MTNSDQRVSEMIQKKIENLVKKIFPVNRYLHRKICEGTGLSLDYSLNKEATDILVAIFMRREYADYFPMQQSARVVDLGAHFGFFSFFAALNLAPDARIISLEPSQDNFAVFQKNLARNSFPNIESLNIALDAQSGERIFYGGPSFNHSFFSQQKKNPVAIPTLSLKDLMLQQNLKRIDFLKVDCEGAEFPILLNSDAATLDKIQTISMEFHDLPSEGFSSLQLIDHLKKNGFGIAKYEQETDYSFQNLSFGKIIATK